MCDWHNDRFSLQYYKYFSNSTDGKLFALKGMKGSAPGSKDGLSISACREIGLLRELQHENIIKVQQVFVNHESRDVWLLFPYAEYDLWGIITYHHKKARRHPGFCPPPEAFLKSVMWQILVGIHYLHSNWVLHRDLVRLRACVPGTCIYAQNAGLLPLVFSVFIFYDCCQ